MNELNDKATNICQAIIGFKLGVSDDEINQAISDVTSIPMYAGLDKTELKKSLLAIYNVKVDENIASSGAAENGNVTDWVWYINGSSQPHKGGQYTWDQNGYIQNTEIMVSQNAYGYALEQKYVNRVRGCKA